MYTEDECVQNLKSFFLLFISYLFVHSLVLLSECILLEALRKCWCSIFVSIVLWFTNEQIVSYTVTFQDCTSNTLITFNPLLVYPAPQRTVFPHLSQNPPTFFHLYGFLLFCLIIVVRFIHAHKCINTTSCTESAQCCSYGYVFRAEHLVLDK